MSQAFVNRLPGIGLSRTATHRQVLLGNEKYLPGGKVIDGEKSRDPLNTSYVYELMSGLLMGIITVSGKYAASILGVLSSAYDGSTTVTVSAATATELVRRVGSSGTFKLTGPPDSAGTVRTVTVTYSAVDTTTGAITVTAVSTAAVWTLTPVDGTDGGTFKLKITLPDGSTATTAAITFNATGATFQSSIDTAIEALTILPDDAVTVVSTDTTGVSVLTFSADLGDVQVEVVEDNLTDGGVREGEAALAHTTTGVDGRFISGAYVQPTDGSETPVTLIPNGFGIRVVDEDLGDIDVPFPLVPIGGIVDSSQLRNWPSDTSLRQWVIDKLNAVGQFVFDNKYGN